MMLKHYKEKCMADRCTTKKMPINKLRNIAIEKGLIDESSKLKKNELLKLFHF